MSDVGPGEQIERAEPMARNCRVRPARRWLFLQRVGRCSQRARCGIDWSVLP